MKYMAGIGLGLWMILLGSQVQRYIDFDRMKAYEMALMDEKLKNADLEAEARRLKQNVQYAETLKEMFRESRTNQLFLSESQFRAIMSLGREKNAWAMPNQHETVPHPTNADEAADPNFPRIPPLRLPLPTAGPKLPPLDNPKD